MALASPLGGPSAGRGGPSAGRERTPGTRSLDVLDIFGCRPYTLVVMAKDFYETLGIKKGASDADIKKAYRKMAQKYHPDRNQGDKSAEQKFKEVNEAYETLSDKQKRSYYDQFGNAGMGGKGFGASGGGQPFGNFDFSQGGFADIFETFFGSGAGGGRKAQRSSAIQGDDIEVVIDLKFHEAAFGTTKEIALSRIAACDHCKASGIEPGSKLKYCAACGGSGEVTSVRSTILGQMRTSHVCDQCGGAGEIPEKPCRTCHGTTRIRQTEKIKVKIPGGVSGGSVVRLTGKGNAGVRGGDSGDLYVHINVTPHKTFARDGADVRSDETIHVVQGVLGDTISIETLDGPVKLKIPAGTQSGNVFRVKERGAAHLNGLGRGDHYVKIRVQIPEKLSRKEKELYAALAKEARLKLADDDGFLSKILG